MKRFPGCFFLFVFFQFGVCVTGWRPGMSGLFGDVYRILNLLSDAGHLPEGMLRPRSDGVTTVIVSNDGLQSSISVEVLNIGDLLFRDGFEP